MTTESKGGVWLKTLPRECGLKIITQSHVYWVDKFGESYRLKGHPVYCPVSTICLKLEGVFVEEDGTVVHRQPLLSRGWCLSFETVRGVVVTDKIVDVEEILQNPALGVEGVDI